MDALAAAVERGVQVRVLIDDAGSRYSWKSAARELRKRGVKVARFLPTFAPGRLFVMNLRNHRKLLVVDGKHGFTGGMNIRHGNLLEEDPKHPIRDIHFRVEGPIVAQLQEVFAEDWCFTTAESLSGEEWFPKRRSAGKLVARGISDGPDADHDKLHLAILGAIAAARDTVHIMTPYFLPETTLITALNLAAMRGVDVEIIVPERNNIRTVGWACDAILPQVLERGVSVWKSPPPFDHSKLFIIDSRYTLIGSTNLDPRSLALNFEFNIECYSEGLAEQLDAVFCERRNGAREVKLAEIKALPLLLRLRNGVARLLAPFL
jgi:cardiolipin synthase